MKGLRKYAPVLHTGFDSGYSAVQMKEFIEWCDKQGFSGFSAEGKASPRTADIDKWLEGFLQGLEFAAREAKEYGLDVWLFDEWGYPTATAGGKVLDGHTPWRSKKLNLTLDLPLEIGQTIALDVPPHFLSASAWQVGRDIFAAPLSEPAVITPADGKITYTATRKRERLCVVSWEYDCFRTVGVFPPDPEDDKLGTLDIMCYEAVSFFISQMHERHLSVLQKYFGNTIKGFFYDEPYLSVPAPYTFDILSQFQKEKGYDITPRLPLMMAGLDNKAMLDYRDVCTTRMAEAFYGQMADWCHAHGVEMVGHQDLDHRVRTLDSLSGHFFKNSMKSDAPGIDYIWAQIAPDRFTDFPRFAGSARRILGKRHAISESFAAAGQSLFPDYMRFCMEHQILRGIDRFFLMIASPVPENDEFMTPLSAKHPHSQAFGAVLNRRISQTNQLVNTSRPVGGIAIYIPMSSAFAEMIRQGHPSVVNKSPFAPTWEYVEESARVLCNMPVDFDYIWREVLLSLPVENGELIAPDGLRIHTLIIPPTIEPDDTISRKLSAFISDGGNVIFLNNQPEEFLGKGTVCPEAVLLPRYIKPALRLSATGMVSLALRKNDSRELFFLLNESDRELNTEIRFPEHGFLQEYDYEHEVWVDLDGYTAAVSLAGMQLAVYALADCQSGIQRPALDGEPMSIHGWTAVTPQDEQIELGDRLTDWREFFDGDYSGWMKYHTVFSVSEDGHHRLALGRVCWAARVTVDEQVYTVPFAPYEVSLYLKAGEHRLCVEVLNTPANKFVGTTDAERAHLTEGWMKTKIGADRKYLESGLLGPVSIQKLGGGISL